MRKLLTTIASGKKFMDLEAHTGRFRREYAKKYGWDYQVVDGIPDAFAQTFAGRDGGRYTILDLKLLLPALFQEYDLLAFMDGDTVLNLETADDLAQYEPLIPRGGFAGVQETPKEARQKYHGVWREHHYAHLEKDLPPGTITRPWEHANAGLLLTRPKESAQAWRELIPQWPQLSVEYKMNIGLVQKGLCHFLPLEWNRVWSYERVQGGLELPENHAWQVAFNRQWRKVIKPLEKARVRRLFRESKMIHFAFEHHKSYWLP